MHQPYICYCQISSFTQIPNSPAAPFACQHEGGQKRVPSDLEGQDIFSSKMKLKMSVVTLFQLLRYPVSMQLILQYFIWNECIRHMSNETKVPQSRWKKLCPAVDAGECDFNSWAIIRR